MNRVIKKTKSKEVIEITETQIISNKQLANKKILDEKRKLQIYNNKQLVNKKILDEKLEIYNNEINIMKNFVKKQSSPINQDTTYINSHKKKFTDFGKILSKHSDEIFYLTYKEIKFDTGKIGTKNWNLYTEDEIEDNLPDGIDLEKICYSGSEKIIKNLKYPTQYKKSGSCICYNMENLAFKHDNLRYVHPKLLKYKTMFLNNAK